MSEGKLTHYYWAVGYIDQPMSEPWFFSEYFLPGGRDLFDLASLTKALVTVPLVWKEIVSKNWHLDLCLYSLWKKLLPSPPPEFCLNMTLSDLLGHTSGLPAWRSYFLRYLNDISFRNRPYQENLVQWLRDLSITKLDKKYVYSDIGYIILGMLLEAKYRCRLSELFSTFAHTCKHLNLDNFGFYPNAKKRCIPTDYCPIRRKWLIGEVHDENAWYLGGCAGHAGLFGSGYELWSYLCHLINQEFFRSFFEINSKRLNLGQTPVGWQLGNGKSSMIFGDATSLGHLGFTGTSFWFDSKKRKLGIFLTNRVISGRVCNWITELRRQAYLYMNNAI